MESGRYYKVILGGLVVEDIRIQRLDLGTKDGKIAGRFRDLETSSAGA